MTQGRKPSPPPLVVIASPSRSNKQPDLNIKGPQLTTYLKRLSIGLFSERLNWANNLQNPIIRERFSLLSVNRGRGNLYPLARPNVCKGYQIKRLSLFVGLSLSVCLSLSIYIYVLYIYIHKYNIYMYIFTHIFTRIYM